MIMIARPHISGLRAATAQALAPLEVGMRYLQGVLDHQLALARARCHRAAARRVLAQLDAATLRDIGIDSSEIDSLLAEAEGRASVTRRRLLAADYRQGPGA
jgi:uncharacterized protein YjiS (DUF1127 family)